MQNQNLNRQNAKHAKKDSYLKNHLLRQHVSALTVPVFLGISAVQKRILGVLGALAVDT